VARRLRLDAELVRRGLARSREHAGDLIRSGRVSVGGVTAAKPATAVGTDAAVVVAGADDDPGYASRGAFKLAGALDAFAEAGLTVSARTAVDAGASTGGFTDVLLRRGASRVVAVDVGYGQLAWALRQNERVTVLDRTNVRDVTPEMVGGAADVVVADLSFISLTTVLPALAALAAADGDLVLMVKPQFEVGRERLGKNGVVRDPDLRVAAVLSVVERASGLGLGVAGVCASPLPGPAGNVEYFVWLRRGASAVVPQDVRAVVLGGPQ
jgi:23S rRNA (cytidine1920-2'-O)/16S rRNA (cytidine1409-2'-O)-methyltransferase